MEEIPLFLATYSERGASERRILFCSLGFAEENHEGAPGANIEY
jgi:hypothetical protein